MRPDYSVLRFVLVQQKLWELDNRLYLETQIRNDGGEPVRPEEGHHELLQTLVHLVVLKTS